MSAFNKILIALDLSSIDKTLLRYTDFITRSLLPEKLLITHVFNSPGVPSLPADIGTAYKDYENRMLGKIEKKLVAKVDKYLGHRTDLKKEIILTTGSPLQNIVELAEREGADMVIIGKKTTSGSGSVLAHKVARKSPCSVLVVPQKAAIAIDKMLLPVDFSDNSTNVLKLAIDLHPKLDNPSITCLHVFDFPGKGLFNKGFKEKVMRMAFLSAINKAFDDLLEKEDLGAVKIKCRQVENTGNNCAEVIHDFATSKKHHMILIGAKGHSTFERLMMGSVAEKLLILCKKIPVMVIKQ